MMRSGEVGEQIDHGAVEASLSRMNLLVGPVRDIVRLTGGVSSDILLVTTARGQFCFKRALQKLRVSADWRAPVDRNRSEIQWIKAANDFLPGIAPAILGDDPVANAFAMTYLAPDEHPLWKTQLQVGAADPETANAAGRSLGRLHAATAAVPGMAASFENLDNFEALRIEPFILESARRRPEVGRELLGLAETLRAARTCLIHGDFSPKNILCGGPQGLVILDAECATWSDPAFDLAFCITHLLLKSAAHRRYRQRILRSLAALMDSYLGHVNWEPLDVFEARLARLTPALMLARVDGKSPVNYLRRSDIQLTRVFALQAIRSPVSTIGDLLGFWRHGLASE